MAFSPSLCKENKKTRMESVSLAAAWLGGASFLLPPIAMCKEKHPTGRISLAEKERLHTVVLAQNIGGLPIH